ncbi:MAG: hypothetical protein WC966_09005 [Bradymonadales bacterium]
MGKSICATFLPILIIFSFILACGNEPIVVEPGETSFRVAGGANVASDLVNAQSIFGQVGDGPSRNNTTPPNTDILKECSLNSNQSFELIVVGQEKRRVSLNSSVNLSVIAKITTLDDAGKVDNVSYDSGIAWTIVRGPSAANNASISPEINTRTNNTLNTTTFSSGTGISKYYVNAFHACAKSPATFTIEVTKPASVGDGGLIKGDNDTINNTEPPSDLGKGDAKYDGKNLAIVPEGGTNLMVYAKDSVDIGGFFLVNDLGEAGAEMMWKLVRAGQKSGATIAGSTKESGKITTGPGGYFSVKFDAGSRYGEQYYLNFYQANMAARPLVISIRVIALPAIGDKPDASLGGSKPAATIDENGNIKDKDGNVISKEDLFKDKDLKDKNGNPIDVKDTTLVKDKNGNWVLVDSNGDPVYADLDGDGNLDPIVIVVDDDGGVEGFDLDGDAKADIPFPSSVVVPPSLPQPSKGSASYDIYCLSIDGKSWSQNCGLRRVPADSHLKLQFRFKLKNSSKYLTSKNIDGEETMTFKVIKGADPNNDGGIWINGKAETDAEGKVTKTGSINPDGSQNSDPNGIISLDFYAGNGFSSTYYVYAGSDKATAAMIPITVSYLSNDSTTQGDKPSENSEDPPLSLPAYDSKIGNIVFVVLGNTALKTPTARTLYLEFVLVKDTVGSNGEHCSKLYATDPKCWVPYERVHWTIIRGASTSNNASIGSPISTADGESKTRNRFYSGTAYDALYYVNAFHPNVLSNSALPAGPKNPPKPLTYTISVIQHNGSGSDCTSCTDPDSGVPTAAMCKSLNELCKDDRSSDACKTYVDNTFNCQLGVTECDALLDKKLNACKTDSETEIDGPDGKCKYTLSLMGEQERIIPTKSSDTFSVKLVKSCDGDPELVASDEDIYLFSLGAEPKEVNNGRIATRIITTDSSGVAKGRFNAGAADGASYHVVASYPGKVKEIDENRNIVFETANNANVSLYYTTRYTGDDNLDPSKTHLLEITATVNDAIFGNPPKTSVESVDFYVVISDYLKCHHFEPSLVASTFNSEKHDKASMTGVKKTDDAFIAQLTTDAAQNNTINLANSLTIVAVGKNSASAPVAFNCVESTYMRDNNTADDPEKQDKLSVTLDLELLPLKLEGSYDMNVMLDLGGFLDESTTLGAEIAKVQQTFAEFIEKVNGKTITEEFVKQLTAPGNCGNWLCGGSACKLCTNLIALFEKPFVQKLLAMGIDALLNKLTGGVDPKVPVCRLVDGIQFTELLGTIKLELTGDSYSGDFVVEGVKLLGTDLDSELPVIKGRISGAQLEGYNSLSIDQFALNFAYGELVYGALAKLLNVGSDGRMVLNKLIDCEKLFKNGILGMNHDQFETICKTAMGAFNDMTISFVESKYIAVNITLAGSAKLELGESTSDSYTDLIYNGRWDGEGSIGGGKQVVQGLWVGLRKKTAGNNSDCGSCSMPAYKDLETFIGENSVCRRKVKENPPELEGKVTAKDCLMGTYEVGARKTNNLCADKKCQVAAVPFCKDDGTFNGTFTTVSEDVIKLFANYNCKVAHDDSCDGNDEIYTSKTSNMKCWSNGACSCEGVTNTEVAACNGSEISSCTNLDASPANVKELLGIQTNSVERLATNLSLSIDQIKELLQIKCLQNLSETACKATCANTDGYATNTCLESPEFEVCMPQG